MAIFRFPKGATATTFPIPPAGFDPLSAHDAALAAHGLPPRAYHRPEHKPIWEFIRSSAHFIEPTFHLIEGSSGAPVHREVGEGTKTSTNWSGAVVFAPPGTAFKTVTAVWNIPEVFSSANDGGSYYSSYWIGMDGSGSVGSPGTELEFAL